MDTADGLPSEVQHAGSNLSRTTRGQFPAPWRRGLPCGDSRGVRSYDPLLSGLLCHCLMWRISPCWEAISCHFPLLSAHLPAGGGGSSLKVLGRKAG